METQTVRASDIALEPASLSLYRNGIVKLHKNPVAVSLLQNAGEPVFKANRLASHKQFPIPKL
jgi:hypothetical protein